jgi:sterol desaturase/sphingolipid hydroxylase (fatty acid hydroxylase superfamily)
MSAKDDAQILAFLSLKVAFAHHLISTPLLSDFAIPFLALWSVYFSLAAAMLVFLHYHSCYLLIPAKWSKHDLLSQINSSARDLLVLLPLSIMYVRYFNLFPLMLTDEQGVEEFYASPLLWLSIPIGVFVGLIIRGSVHRILHLPVFYKRIHKMHHIIPEHMTPFATFNDHPIEFICMEVVGTFLLPCLFQPLPAPVLAGVWAFLGSLGICDHSNAMVPGSYFIDADYHLTHHQLTSCNYAELMFLDQICGTLHTGKVKGRKEHVM